MPANAVSFIASSGGTGTFVFGTARPSYMSLAQANSAGFLPDGTIVSYFAVDNIVAPTMREWGQGTYSLSGNSLVRTTVVRTMSGTTVGTSALNFGTAPYVFITVLAGYEVRQVLSADTTVYLSPTGSDTTGDGTAANPWFTPNQAIAALVGGNANQNNSSSSLSGKGLIDLNGFTYNIQFADGTYDYSVVAPNACVIGTSLFGGGTINFDGHVGDPTKVIINGPGSGTGAFINILPGTVITGGIGIGAFTIQNMHNVVVNQGVGQVYTFRMAYSNNGNNYEAIGAAAEIYIGGAAETLTGSYNSHLFPRNGGLISWNPASTTFTTSGGAPAFGHSFVRIVDAHSRAYVTPPGTQVGWSLVTGTKIGGFGGRIQYFGGIDNFAGCPGNGTPILDGGADIIVSTVSAPATDGPYFKVGQADYTYYQPTSGTTLALTLQDMNVVLDSTAAPSTLTIRMPASPMDGQTVNFRSSQAVSTLTLTATSTSAVILAAPSSLSAGQHVDAIFRLSNNTWYF